MAATSQLKRSNNFLDEYLILFKHHFWLDDSVERSNTVRSFRTNGEVWICSFIKLAIGFSDGVGLAFAKPSNKKKMQLFGFCLEIMIARTDLASQATQGTVQWVVSIFLNDKMNFDCRTAPRHKVQLSVWRRWSRTRRVDDLENCRNVCVQQMLP